MRTRVGSAVQLGVLWALVGSASTSLLPDVAAAEPLSGTNARVLGFESPADWSGRGLRSDFASEGSYSLAVNAAGWTTVPSVPLSSVGQVGSEASFDLFVPAPCTWGEVRVIVQLPSAGEWYRDIGSHLLSDLPAGQFSRLDFTIPPDLASKLSGTYDDLVLTVVVSGPTGTYLLDSFQFGAAEGGAALTLQVPADFGLNDMALLANGSLRVNDRAAVRNAAGAFARVASSGGPTSIGVSASVGSIWSDSVVLRERAHVYGSVVSSGAVEQQNGVMIDGTLNVDADTPLRPLSWDVTAEQGEASVIATAAAPATVSPGAYRELVLQPGALARLEPGNYVFDRLQLEPGSFLRFSDTEATRIQVRSGLIMRGTLDGDPGRLILTYLGSSGISLERPWRGTLIAPNAPISFASLPLGEAHIGAAYGRDIELHQDVVFIHAPFGTRFAFETLPLLEVGVIGSPGGFVAGVPRPSAPACPSEPEVESARLAESGNEVDGVTYVTRDNPLLEGDIALHGTETVSGAEQQTQWSTSGGTCSLDAFAWLKPESGLGAPQIVSALRPAGATDETGPARVPWVQRAGQLSPGEVYGVGANRRTTTESEYTRPGAAWGLPQQRIALDPDVLVVPVLGVVVTNLSGNIPETKRVWIRKLQDLFDFVPADESRRYTPGPTCHDVGDGIVSCEMPLSYGRYDPMSGYSQIDTRNRERPDEDWARCKIQFRLVDVLFVPDDSQNQHDCSTDRDVRPVVSDQAVLDQLYAEFGAERANELVSLQPVWVEFAPFDCRFSSLQGGWMAKADSSISAMGPNGAVAGSIVMLPSYEAVDQELAHELGHIFELYHVNTPENVMSEGDSADQQDLLTDEQCSDAKRAAARYDARFVQYAHTKGLTPLPSRPVVEPQRNTIYELCELNNSVDRVMAGECALIGGSVDAALTGSGDPPWFCCVSWDGMTASMKSVCPSPTYNGIDGTQGNPVLLDSCRQVCCNDQWMTGHSCALLRASGELVNEICPPGVIR